MTDYLQPEIDRLKQKITENQALLSDPVLGKLAQTELDALNEQLLAMESAIPSPYQGEGQGEVGGDIDNSPCILEIRSAAGVMKLLTLPTIFCACINDSPPKKVSITN